MEPTIDPKSEVVYCECGQPLQDQEAITIFARRQMRTLKQTNKHARIQEKVKQSNDFLKKIKERESQSAKAANPRRPTFKTEEDVEKFVDPNADAPPLENLKEFLSMDTDLVSPEAAQELPVAKPSKERPTFKNIPDGPFKEPNG